MFLILFLLLITNTYSKTKIHLICHSHCDPGWLKTTDEYYASSVGRIFETSITSLLAHYQLTYNFAESIYIHMFYKLAPDERRRDLVNLINTGHFRIHMGGWVMNDQACVTYSSSIDQMTLGHVFLKNTLKINENVYPDEGFTVDPFGMSNVQVYLYQKMGFHNHIIARIPWYTRDEYMKNKTLEFKWIPFEGYEENSLFTHTNAWGYSGVDTMQWWWRNKENPAITTENIQERAEYLMKYFDDHAQYFTTNNTMIYWGADFAWVDSVYIYKNLLRIVNYINEHYGDKYTISFSGIKQYFKSLMFDKPEKEFPVRTEQDYYVYNNIDDENRYESGYFVSQPRLKWISRVGEQWLKLYELVFSLSYLKNKKGSETFFSKEEIAKFYKDVWSLRDKNGQLLHHDAITGTEKWHVSDFYWGEIQLALEKNEFSTKKLFSYFTSKDLFIQNKKKSFLNHGKFINEGKFIKHGDKVGFFLFNTLGWERKGYVWVNFMSTEKAEKTTIKVTDRSGKKEYKASIVKSDDLGIDKEVLIEIDDFVPLGLQYFILHVDEKTEKKNVKTRSNEDYVIQNDCYDVYFNGSTGGSGRITRIVNKKSKVSTDLDINYMYYQSTAEKGKQSSGAYIFTPLYEYPFLETTDPVEWQITENDMVVELHQKFTAYIETVTRLYKSADKQEFIETEFIRLGEIPKDHEIILRVDTEKIKNKNIIYHDEMALSMKKKASKSVRKKVAANFWPTQYASFIKDDNMQFTILTSKSQGVATFKEGSIETMLHRRTSMDDSNGVNQPLNDKFTFKKEHCFRLRFILDTPANSIDLRHYHSYDLNYPLEVFPLTHEFWNIDNYPSDWLDSYSLLKSPLPKQINFLSFYKMNEPDFEEDIIFRLMNIYEPFETKEKINVDLDDVFQEKVCGMKEMTLSLLYETQSDVQKKNISLKPYDVVTYKVKF